MTSITTSPKGTSSNSSQALHDLEKIVRANVRGSDNELRSKAEVELKQIKQRQPANYFTGLCALMAHSSDPMIRSFAAVLLRQILAVTDDTYDNIPFQCQAQVRQTLLTCCAEEKDRDTLLQVSHALGQCAVHILCKQR
ncbi:hypothetical protein RFI_40338 [Reticulomyxa filosa]|uniref:Importin N-terminal domain-containing protein n=1 Tax=Reticulomyxa filosa TaxID=46433 RepID=X6L7A2_RETFI|nr:hypothetical protein RFI_40338 [Reticulomyxa filosa]|eukprot:ETN97190.1 hypothetical protein RFI_40338 [Reticulomyxa filosa]